MMVVMMMMMVVVVVQVVTRHGHVLIERVHVARRVILVHAR
jgi:hypothetical protein